MNNQNVEQQHGELEYANELVKQWRSEVDEVMKVFNKAEAEMKLLMDQADALQEKGISFEEAVEKGLITPDVKERMNTLYEIKNEQLNKLGDLMRKAQNEVNLTCALGDFMNSLEQSE